MDKIREYFYGNPHTSLGRADLNPYSVIVPFSEMNIRRVGEGILAPSSALPLGMDRHATETKMVKVEPGTILLHSVIAVSTADIPTETEELSEDEISKRVLESNILGFIYM